jgi:hypothetical protein
MYLHPLGPLGPVRSPAWVWEILPRSSTMPMVAMGITDKEDKARRQVEAIVLDEHDTAAYGLLITPAGHHEACLRTRDGGTHWKELWPDGQLGNVIALREDTA